MKVSNTAICETTNRFQIVGFGSTENNTNADTLKVLNTVIRNDSTCNNFNPKLYTKLMNEFTFCAGYGPDYGNYFQSNNNNVKNIAHFAVQWFVYAYLILLQL